MTLEILPVLNKVDLPTARPEQVCREIEDVIGLDTRHAVHASAKQNVGISEILEQIVRLIPPPRGKAEAPLRALIFDSWFDAYLGIVVMVRVVDGRVRVGDKIRFMATAREYEVTRLGNFTPFHHEKEVLLSGEVGFICASIKTIGHTKIGDTVTLRDQPSQIPLPGYAEVKPMVFSGIYPVESDVYEELKEALRKLTLNDASITYETETSSALGFGFRCGFLGLLHMEIAQERLEREFELQLIATAPTVVYRVHLKNGTVRQIDNPAHLPSTLEIERIEEPYVLGKIFSPPEFLGNLLTLCREKTGNPGEHRVPGDQPGPARL